MAISTVIKTHLRRLASSSLVSRMLAPLVEDSYCIFNMHRFGVPGFMTGMPGIDETTLSGILERLRKDRVPIAGIDDLVSYLDGGEPPPPGSVMFTSDDGYSDSVLGAEIFARYDCPVTVFLITGFLDGRLWMWWDQVEYLCRLAPRGRFRFGAESEVVEVVFEDASDRGRIEQAERLWSLLKLMPESKKLQTIRRFGETLGVDIPRLPPPEYAPLSWNDVRRLERTTVRFGPHTVTHPILARTTDEQAAREIEVSWSRLKEEVDRPVPVLAYPNGQPDDFGLREQRLAERVGLRAAVTTFADYVWVSNLEGFGRFEIPRFGGPRNASDASVLASALRRGTSKTRKALSRKHIV